MMSWLCSIVAWIVCGAMAFGLSLMEPVDKDRNWGSITQALIFHQVRKYLLYLDPRKDHVKYWRPQILLLVSDPRKSCAIIEFTNSLKKGGLFLLGHVKIGEMGENLGEDPISSETGNWYSLIDFLNIKAFVEITMSESLRKGMQQLARLAGIGALKPHTVVLGLPFEDDEYVQDDFASGNYKDSRMDSIFPKTAASKRPMDAVQYLTIIEDLLKLRKNVCLYRNFQKLDHGDWFKAGFFRTSTRNNSVVYCDVWLVDFLGPTSNSFDDTISEFMLQMSAIVSKVQKWKKLTIRIMVRVRDTESDEARKVESMVHKKLDDFRIEAEVLRVQLNPGPEAGKPKQVGRREFQLDTISDRYMKFMNGKILEKSAYTAISFMYLRQPPVGVEDEGKRRFIKLLEILSKDMPPTLFIHGIHSVISKEL